MIYKYSELRKYFNYLNTLSKVVSFRDWIDDEKAIVMRHDVDLDVELAYQFALIEKETNIGSTFFILTTCDTYNVLNSSNAQKLKEMSDMGFEIGLHFDPTVYDEDVDFQSKVDFESSILESITGRKVESVSLHNPSRNNQFPLFEGYNNAYDSKIFNNDIYISDSRMDFNGKDIYEFAKRVNDSAIQILLHPMHYSESGLGYSEIMGDYLSQLVNKVDSKFRRNSTFISQVSEPTEVVKQIEKFYNKN